MNKETNKWHGVPTKTDYDSCKITVIPVEPVTNIEDIDPETINEKLRISAEMYRLTPDYRNALFKK